MKLTKDQVAAVVTEASKKMTDPNYSAVLVGGFVQSQTPVAQFISAHERELGGAEAIVNVIFHCALVAQCFQRAGGRVRTLSYEDLDAAARGEPLCASRRRSCRCTSSSRRTSRTTTRRSWSR